MTPPPSRGRLRVGLLVDSLVQPAWVVEAVRQIMRDGIAEIVCVVVNEKGESPVPRKLPALQRVARWIENRDVLGYAAYQRFDARRYPPIRDPEAPEDLSPVIGEAPLVIPVTPRMTKRLRRTLEILMRLALEHQAELLRVAHRVMATTMARARICVGAYAPRRGAGRSGSRASHRRARAGPRAACGA